MDAVSIGQLFEGHYQRLDERNQFDRLHILVDRSGFEPRQIESLPREALYPPRIAHGNTKLVGASVRIRFKTGRFDLTKDYGQRRKQLIDYMGKKTHAGGIQFCRVRSFCFTLDSSRSPDFHVDRV